MPSWISTCLRLVPAVALAVAVTGACGSSKNGFSKTQGDSGTSSDAAADGGGDDGSSLIGGEGGMGTPMSLAITPGNSMLTVTDLSAPPTETLVAHVTYSGGAVVTTPAQWTIDRPDIASVDSGGVLTPTAAVFGTANVKAVAAGLTATTPATVALALVVHDPSIPSGSETLLSGATTADPSVTSLAYPYDATVFPLGLPPPELQWNGGSAGDDYLVHFTGPSFDLQIFTTADPPSRYTLTTALWSSLTSTAAAANASVSLSRLSGGTAYASAKETWKVANADLRGIIYYWEISEGQIIQLDIASGMAQPVFASGPSQSLGAPTPINSGSPLSPPWEDNGSGNTRCVACHSVSKDGSTLMSVFSRQSSTGPVGFVSLASDQISVISDYTTNATYDALSPDGTYAVVNYGTKTMGMLASASATPVASALDGQSNLCDPTFSPDGTLFAYASSCDPGFGYPVEFRTSNLSLYSFATTAPYFTNPLTVLTSTGIGDAIAFPSFSPDSKWIVYQRGDYSRAKYTDSTMANVHGNDDLYITAAQANSTQIALANMNGTAVLSAANQHLNYAPTVNPIAVGGYFWVVFTSPRDYGNEMVAPGTTYPNDPTYANRKQLWVGAIDANVGTADPSHPAFWLPGQDATTANFFGYWALAPCKQTPADGGAASCTAGYECCSGFCENGSCGSQPPGCSNIGDKCTSTGQCCNTSGSNIECIGGFCEPQQPQ